MASAPHFSLIITLLILISAKDVDSFNYKESNCFGKDFSYSSESAFETSLNHTLLEVLPSIVAMNGSSHTNVGQGIDQIYALFYCTGDISLQDCHDCVQLAAKTLLQNCLKRKEGIVWYEECTLRYSNSSILYIEKEEPFFPQFNYTSIAGTLNQYTNEFNTMMSGLIHQAAFGSNNTVVGFAKTEEDLSGSTFRLWGLVQCSPDIVGVSCETCLRSAQKKLNGWEITMMFLPSCTLRFGLVPPQNTSAPPSGSILRNVKFIVLLAIGSLTIVVLLLWLIIHCSRQPGEPEEEPEVTTSDPPSQTDSRLHQGSILPPAIDPRLQYQVEVLENATDNFSEQNMIGKGGFGVVYKGVLPDGQEIAVKKLLNFSSQRHDEFNTEIGLLANVRHRNLVKLLGFSLAGERKLLVYEFMPNKSLDLILFDPRRKGELNWPKRYNIIKGIARGMLYLHQDSPDRIIHRDLKAANVLLDANMEPKICDFGIARVSNFEETHFTTGQVVGTIGYIAPECYSTHHFSVKSDVYSFGVLVLEIVSGKRAIKQSEEETEYLLTYAWKCWEDGSPLKLLDALLGDTCPRDEVIKCIQLAFLCVQEKDKRPHMTSVVASLDSRRGLSNPKPPVFLYIARSGVACPQQMPRRNTFSTFCINFLENFA